MKFALVLCIAALGSQNFQVHCHHHHHHHHQHENPQYAIATLYPTVPHYGSHCSTPCEHPVGHHSHNHEHFGYYNGAHHLKDNLGASIYTSYSGTAFEPNDCGQQECMGSYSGSNVFVHPANVPYDKFAAKCRIILQSLLDFISRPVEFGCTPGSALNLDLKSRIVNHNIPCDIVCMKEGGIVPALEDKAIEVPVPISTPDCVTEVYPVEIRSRMPSECGSCSPSTVPSVKMIPVEVAPVREPIHHVHLEPAMIPSHPCHHEVMYEKPVIEAEIITPQTCEEEDPKERKHQLHQLHKQIHQMMHNQKKHHHHH